MQNKEKKIEARIEQIIQDDSLNVSEDNLKKYLSFLIANISLPHRVTGIDSCFTYTKYKNPPSGNDEFELIGYEEDVENYSNIFAKVKHLKTGQVFSLQLFEFKSMKNDSKEAKILNDYSYWIEDCL